MHLSDMNIREPGAKAGCYLKLGLEGCQAQKKEQKSGWKTERLNTRKPFHQPSPEDRQTREIHQKAFSGRATTKDLTFLAKCFKLFLILCF